MVKKTTKKVKVSKKKIEVEEEEDENEGGASLDDAFADDEDVSYAENKPKKEKKKKDDDLDDELDEAEEETEKVSQAMNGGEEITNDYTIKASKPVSKVKKGDNIRIDGKEFEVDAHYVMIDHKTTKEMTIEIFDKDDKDYQLRYFDDQVESTMEFYELQEIMYLKRPFTKVEW